LANALSPALPHGGREQIAADFAVICSFKSNLDLQPLIAGRLKNKKQPAKPVFLTEALIPTATPSSLPRGRVRERATSHNACIWTNRVVGKIAAIWENALSPALPHGGGSRLRQIQALQVV